MGNFQYNEALANVGNQLASAMLANKKSEMEAQQKAEMHNNILKFLANLQTPQPIQNTYVQPEQTARPQSFGGQLGVSPTATLPQRPMIGSPFVNNQSANQGMADIQGQQKNEAMSNILAGGGGQELATIMQLQKMGQPDWREAGSDQSGRYFYDPSNPTRVLPFTPPVAQKPQDGEWTYSTKTPDPNLYPITKTKGNTISHLYEKRGADGQTYYDYRSEGTQPEQSGVDIGNIGIDWSKSGDDFIESLKKIDPELAILVKEVGDYKKDVRVAPSALRKGSKQYSQQQLSALATQYKPDYQDSNYGIVKGKNNDYGFGNTSKNITALNTALLHVGDLQDAVDALNNGNIALWNKIANSWHINVGDPMGNKVQAYNSIRNAVANEVATALKGSAGTDIGLKEELTNFDTNKGLGVQTQANASIARVLGDRLRALGLGYENVTGRKFPVMYKTSPYVLNKYNIPYNTDYIQNDKGFINQDMQPQTQQGKPQGKFKILKVE